MSSTNDFYPTCNPQGMLDRLEGQVKEVISNVSFPLSLNFRLLSVIADGTYALQFLKAINSQGQEYLPNLFQYPYAQPDWYQISGRFYELSIEFRKTVDEFKPYPIHLVYLHPKNIEGWRNWEAELRYVRLEKNTNPDKDIYTSKYIQYLNPVNPNNIWAFVCKHLEQGMANEPFLRSIKETFSVFSSEERSKTPLLICLAADILMKISDEAFRFDQLLNNTQEIIQDKEGLNRLYVNYCQRIYDCFECEMQKADNDFDEWMNDCIQPLSIRQLNLYKEEAWFQLKNSGFLDDWTATNKLSACDEGDLQRLFNTHFFPTDKEENGTDAFVGKYIYKHQLLPGWNEKTASFIRYVQLSRKIEEAGTELEIPEETSEKGQDSKQSVIKQCIQQMIDENLLDENVQWYSIYLILSEFYGFENGMRDFERVMNRWGFAKEEYNFSYDSLKQVNKNRIYGNCKFNRWVKLSETNQTKQFLKKYNLAKRFKEVLEEKLT